MVETFRTCKKAYAAAYVRFTTGSNNRSLAGSCRRFLLRALSEVHKSKLTTVQQVQKYVGQEWPLDRAIDNSSQKEICTRAFLFALKTLTRYVGRPYSPPGSEVASVALRVRARVAHVRVYLEDTIDLVLWYPNERRLELVNFQTQAVKPMNPAWPSASTLIKAYLGERLKIRWPYEKLTITNFRVGAQDSSVSSIQLDEAIYRVHWEEMLKTLEEMKEPVAHDAECSSGSDSLCRYCAAMKSSSVSQTAVAALPPTALSA
jgi:hypothetical protein